jgi:transposase-like protein
MRGRHADDLEELLETRDGTPEDKQRLRAIYDVLYGQARLHETCQRLDIGETYFRQLRDRAVQGALDAIKPRPPGRPSRRAVADAKQVGALERELAEKDLQLQEALVRAEVALILPRRAEAEPEKRGHRRNVKLRKRKPR